MKRASAAIAAMTVVALCLFVGQALAQEGEKPAQESAQPAQEGAKPTVLTPAEAKAKVGEQVVVEGTIVKVHIREKGPAMLNFDENWKEGLSVAIFKKEKFGDLKATYEGKKVRVSGKVTEYRGQPQIKVNDPAKIEVLQ
jgi:DNA/RNA endonuclease YhcR with UshA esterase domain